jgi:hypothetical protein
MKKRLYLNRKKLFSIVAILLLLPVSIIATCYVLFKQEEQQKQFYIGVTYCGSSIQEAKELIDKMKNSPNLFILQLGTIRAVAEIEEIGDYAVASELNFAVYNSKNVNYFKNDEYYLNKDWNNRINEWANTAKERWGKHFV